MLAALARPVRRGAVDPLSRQPAGGAAGGASGHRAGVDRPGVSRLRRSGGRLGRGARPRRAGGPGLRHGVALHCGRDAASACRAAVFLNSDLARGRRFGKIRTAHSHGGYGAWSMSAPVGITAPPGHARPGKSSPSVRAKVWTAAAILSCWLAAAAVFCAGPARIGFLSDDFDLFAAPARRLGCTRSRRIIIRRSLPRCSS